MAAVLVDKLVDEAVDAEVDAEAEAEGGFSPLSSHCWPLSTEDAPRVPEYTSASSTPRTYRKAAYYVCLRHEAGQKGYYGDRQCVQCNHVQRSRCWLRLWNHLDQVAVHSRLWHVVFTIKATDDPLRRQIKRLTGTFCKRLSTSAKKKQIRGGCWFVQATRNEHTGHFHTHVHTVIETEGELPDWIGEHWHKEIHRDAWLYRKKLSWYVVNPLAAPFADYPQLQREVVVATHKMKLRGVVGSWYGVGLFAKPRRQKKSAVVDQEQSPEGLEDVQPVKPLTDPFFNGPEAAPLAITATVEPKGTQNPSEGIEAVRIVPVPKWRTIDWDDEDGWDGGDVCHGGTEPVEGVRGDQGAKWGSVTTAGDNGLTAFLDSNLPKWRSSWGVG